MIATGSGKHFGYPSRVVVSSGACQAATLQLLITAQEDKTEDAALLYGYVVQEMAGGWAPWVMTAVPGVTKATVSTVELQEESFVRARRVLEAVDGADQSLLGWWHSQPGYGVRPSPTDVDTMRTLFKRPWMVMAIDDPHGGERAVYAWRGTGVLHRIPMRVMEGPPGRYLRTMGVRASEGGGRGSGG